MRLLVVPMELPVPTNSGGRVDVARRLRLLRSRGHQVALMSWHNVARDGERTAAQDAELAALCDTHHVSCIRRSAEESLRRLALLWRWPSHVAARWVTLDRPAALAWARRFDPDVVMLDGLYGVAAARWLARQLGVPWVYRSHNVEHVYMRQQQRRAASRAARWKLAANLVGLRRVERATVRDAGCTYDISEVDAEFWRAAGMARVYWLPTVVDAAFADEMAAAASGQPVWDVAYFGNLNTPNNVQAVQWLLQQVLPRVPQLGRLVLAGSRPDDTVRRLAAADARVTLLADPPSIPAVAGLARVLVNPMPSSSGVNLKSVEMLFSRAHLVSTPAGVQGLPTDAAACFEVHAEPQGFADAVSRALRSAPPDDGPRRRARRPFADEGIAELLQASLQHVLHGAVR